MPSEPKRLKLLLDEHYPGWLADDARVLAAAVAERRVVVTEDVTTFSAAVAFVPQHVGIVYCHHARFPRTRSGLFRLHKALVTLATDPPAGLGEHPVTWWLADPEQFYSGNEQHV